MASQMILVLLTGLYIKKALESPVVITATNTSVRQTTMLTKFLTTLTQMIEHTVEYLVAMA